MFRCFGGLSHCENNESLSLTDYEKRSSPDQAKKIDDLLHNSFSLLHYMQVCLHNNRFEEIKSIGDQCIARAVEEGNLYTLIEANMVIGTGYASEGHLGVAITYYERAARFIKSSIWPRLESDINYNLGASYLEIGDLKKAAKLLHKIPGTYGFYLHHKLACLALAEGDETRARRELGEMKKNVQQDPVRKIIYEETAIQVSENYESNPHSLAVIETLIDCLKDARTIGYLRFHRALITKVFIAHRKYKQAYEYERMLVDIAS